MTETQLTSRFYLITLRGQPVYVGYTNRPIKQRFAEHKHDKDFGDVEPEITLLDTLSFDFSWDIDVINDYAQQVDDRERELIVEYNTQDSIYQKAIGGGQTWADVKHFVRTNHDNPKFTGLVNEEILTLIARENITRRYMSHFVSRMDDPVAIYMKNFVTTMDDPVAIYMRNFVNNMSDPVAIYMGSFVSHMDDPVAIYMKNFINHMDDPVAIYMQSFVSNMDDPVAIYMKNFVHHMDDPVAIYMKSFVKTMDDPVAIYMKHFVSGMDDPIAIYMKNFVSGMDDPVAIYMKNFVGNMH